MEALVFVTTELSPFTPGGIGRVVHNMLRTMSEADRSRAIVLMVDGAVNPRLFEAVFPGARLVQVDTAKDPQRHTNGRRVPPDWAFSDTRWHWRSAAVMLALEQLAREMPIGYVEFPDWHGLAFCTLQEHRFSGLLPQACIAVRLHSTHTVILNAEARVIGGEDLNICDMERKCLRDCDRVVAQLPRVAEAVRELMGFSAEEWNDRVVVHSPTVLLDHQAPATHTIAAAAAQPLMFTSKVQRFKRPDLFVRGVSAYLRAHPEYRGQACLSASRGDEAYAATIDAMVPADLRARFESMPHLSQQAREAAFSQATVIVPSNFESFCLAAYEASLLGARVILNAKNPAFDDDSPWRDGVNCFKFDGTAIGLLQAIERSFNCEQPIVPVELRCDPWPWENWQARMAGHAGAAMSEFEPKVSIVVSHFNLGNYLCETLQNVLAIEHQNIEIVVVDDASVDDDSIQTIELLIRLREPRLKVIRLAGNVGLAAARNIGVQHATGRYVLTLDADDLIDPCFVGQAVRALELHREFDVVVTPAAYFIDGQMPPMHGAVDAVDYSVFTGEARAAGLLENRFSTATALFRRSALERFRYDEDLHCFEDWSLYMRMCDAGVRFLVTTDVFFFYRHRNNSMVHAPRDASMRRIEYADLLRTSAPAAFRAGSRHLMLGLASPSRGPSSAGACTAEPAGELLSRLGVIEQQLHGVLHATTPFAKLFRIPRYCWRQLLPLRRVIARARGVA
ncbi:glycosyltransferase involved in cell wall biosynthesis [Variovorax boronicumulans]|uniref:Glycosyltransferase involved in cell wall biosynthesis n=1 Tax=Variovorax boronicumulans TaxID=436515 RepID=A0AAW8DVX1_9BURK|nr:glycosyltransferase [Variovorax boronicumulans]MDP9877999.1 glycosyltransferase involved in cell wall biosynthesis [Variovorax boronicumulans]MDP9923282.1 glycosyltransferase involved in cell wall biosynthesis [Variovorax boronicumulans]